MKGEEYNKLRVGAEIYYVNWQSDVGAGGVKIEKHVLNERVSGRICAMWRGDSGFDLEPMFCFLTWEEAAAEIIEHLKWRKGDVEREMDKLMERVGEIGSVIDQYVENIRVRSAKNGCA